MEKLSSRRKKSRGIAIKKCGEQFSSDLINSINSRVDAIARERLAPPIPSLTTDQLLTLLNQKISSISSKSNDQLRQLQRVFGGGTNKDLTVEQFKNKVAKLGVGLTSSQASNLFERIDADNSGGISLREFVTGIMQKEMTAEPWYEKRRKEMIDDSKNSKTNRGQISTSMFREKVSNNMPTRTPKEICQIVYSRIVALSKRPTDQMRRIRQIFALTEDDATSVGVKSSNRDSKQLTPRGLRRQLAKIEVLLKDSEVVPLFQHLDDDNSGSIDMQEFLQGVMPRDITRDNVWDKKEKMTKAKQKITKAKARKNVTQAAALFRTDPRPELTLPDILKILNEKIEQIAKKPTDRVRRVAQLFNTTSNSVVVMETSTTNAQPASSSPKSIKDGVGLPMFRANIEKLGLTLTSDQAFQCFQHFDTDNSGSVSLHEFLSALLPKDYSGESWHEKSQQSTLKSKRLKKTKDQQDGKTGFHSGMRPEMTKDQVINSIRQKMDMFSTKPSDAFRQITRIFGSSGDCNFETFSSHIEKLRVYLTTTQAKELFEHFDIDKSGTVSIVEFITGVQSQEAKNISMFSSRQIENEMKVTNKKKINRDFFRPKPSRVITRSVEQLKEIIMKKIEQKSTKPSDQIRQVRKLFAQNKPDDDKSMRKNSGLSADDMAIALRALGVILNDKEINALFASFDEDQSGDLSMQELMAGLAPKHFTSKPVGFFFFFCRSLRVLFDAHL